MNFDYSVRATLAITKASLQSMLRSPSAIIFSLAFPIIFILVFGFIGGRSNYHFDIAFTAQSDTTNPIYGWMSTDSNTIIHTGTQGRIDSALLKGNLDAVVTINKSKDSSAMYNVVIQTSTVSIQNGQLFKSVVKEVISKISEQSYKNLPQYASIVTPPPVQARVYQTIDFILPGQIGFSMLSAGVFGAAFVFFSLRQTLVIKRFFATPVSKTNIIIGEMISRLVFQLIAAAIIILIGKFFFHFTLINGIVTFFEMLFLCAFGLIVFMGFGFIISGLAKSESSIPPLANIITLPQFLLAGTFFSTDVFPKWLQPISKALPLTYMNDAMRKVAFEGLNLWDIKFQLMIMLIWGIVVYAVAIKTFKWE
jgi:ABC-2 type transport system permease protein